MRKMTISRISTLAWALTACAGPPVGGQAAPPAPPADGSLERLHVYEMPLRGDQTQVDAQETPFIEVNGSASVDVPADRAHVAFAVETRAETAAAAAAANADAMDAVLRAIRGGRFRGLTVATFGYTLRPEYSTAQGRARVIEGYTAVNNVRATLEDVNAVGRVIDAAIGAGANRVASIAFDASDPDDARRDALAQAVRNARAQAEVIAGSLGFELGPPLEVHGGAQVPGPRPLTYDLMGAARAMEAPTPIEAGDQTVSANVTVRFALGSRLPGR